MSSQTQNMSTDIERKGICRTLFETVACITHHMTAFVLGFFKIKKKHFCYLFDT